MTVAGSIRVVRVSAAALCIFGAVVLAWQFRRYLKVFPGGVAVAVVLELPLLVAGFAAVRLLRPVRLPPLTWSAAALIWGGSAATGCALLANRGLTGLWFKGAGVRFASGWSDALSAPLNEELLKISGVVLIVLAAPQVINGPLDALIYGALTGLGFQVTENVIYGLNSIVLSGATNPGQAALNSALVRVGTTGPGSHWTMTAVAGAGIGYLVERSRRGGPVLPAIACLLLAMSMHLLFDAPAVIVGIKVGVNFLIVAALYLFLRHDFLERAHELLADWAGAGLISQSEARSVLSWRYRRTELRRAASPAERHRLLRRQREILAAIEREAA